MQKGVYIKQNYNPTIFSNDCSPKLEYLIFAADAEGNPTE